MTRLILLAAFFTLAACGAEPETAPAEPPPVVPADGATTMPGPDAASFVGRWAAQAAWCGAAQGPERPIQITTTRFEGYENSCAIDQVRQAVDAHEAVLTCTAEGTTTQERVRMRVVGDQLTLSWLDRAGSSSTTFQRCAAPQPAPVPIPGPGSVAPPEPTG